MQPQATTDLYQAQQRRIVALAILLRYEWAKLGPDLNWPLIAVRVAAMTSRAMVGAATDGAASVGPALAQTGFEVEPLARVRPEALGESASDGRDLESLLYSSVVRARTASYPTVEERLAAGGAHLEMLARTQVADAARAGAGLEIAARPKVGWIRYVNPPCCGDCAVQAGKWFRFNEGFERHPGCDCVHRPSHEGEVASGYAQDVPPEQVTGLSEGERQALLDGADISQIVNARRGRSRNKMTTAAGTTRRGWYGGGQATGERPEVASVTDVGRRGAVANYTVRRAAPRLTPDAIYAVSATRDEAVERLRRNGYFL